MFTWSFGPLHLRPWILWSGKATNPGTATIESWQTETQRRSLLGAKATTVFPLFFAAERTYPVCCSFLLDFVVISDSLKKVNDMGLLGQQSSNLASSLLAGLKPIALN